ncbi:MAG: PAS domain S-box protein [Gammaproteobacteria bacterium]|nr:PAS domain S-box protein [Gammaproteobacteria bacterium]
MITFKLDHKLLFFWLSSIILSLLILGSVFLFLNNEINRDSAHKQIDEAFDDLSVYIDNRKNLLRNVRSFSMREDVVSSLSMISHYQNPKDYQSIVFDSEKKSLAGELVKLLKAENVSVIAAYDGYMRLASFAFVDEKYQSHIGYISYDKGIPQYFISDITLKNYQPVDKLPFWLEPVKEKAMNFEEHENDQNNVHIHAHGDRFTVGFHSPVLIPLHDKSKERVGLITIGELGRSFVEGISRYAKLDFYLSFDDGNWISTGDQAQIGKRIDALSSKDLAAGNLQGWHFVEQPDYIYGIANYPVSNGKSLKFIFELPRLYPEFTILQKAMIVVLLVNVFLLFPLGVYFLRRTILHPVSRLVAGIEALSRGRYEEISVPSSNDELAFLTSSFNSMARSIKIRETELQKLSLAVEQSPVSMIITSIKGDIEYTNAAFTAITGYSAEDVIGKNTKIFQGGETPVKVYQHLWQTITSGQQWNGVFHNRNKNGDFIWQSTRIIPIKSPNGKIINYLSLNEDITLHREAQEQMYLQSEALQAAADGIVITDNEGIIQWVNPAFENMTGYAFAEVIGKKPNILKSGKQDSSIYEQLWRTILLGKTWHGELYNKRSDGEIYLEEEYITPVMDASGKTTNFVAIKRDITAQRKHEEIIRQSRKLEAIGEMAGGIAHDFNNLLGIMSGNLEILRRFSGDNADMNKWIDSGIKTAKRGSALTKRLLSFSRLNAAEVKTISVSKMLEDMRSMIDKTAGLNIGVNYELEHDLWLTDIDAGDLEDAMINLVINARDAMQENGRLDISVYNEIVDEDKASYMHGSSAGDYVVLCVSDSGSGISKDVQQRMFDPFFTTKEKGKGTGLGLSMVHGFVRRSHGYVDVVSESGAGTTFYIYLPRSDKDELNVLDSKLKVVLPTGTETILVVDDEPQLVEVATIYLSELGYRVLQATNSKQAMTFLESGEKIDLLFSDIIMPGGKDGYELSTAALQLHPKIKILLVSGYTRGGSDLSKDLRLLASKRLAKPYSKLELAQRVRFEIDGEENNE